MSVDLVEIVHNIREQLTLVGMSGMRRLGLSFAANDVDKSGYVDFLTFEHVLAKAAIFLKRQSMSRLYRHFDASCEERVYYPDVLRAIQGSLDDSMVSLVSSSFDSLDTRSMGLVHIDDIFARFRPHTHPHVLSGQKTVVQLQNEFQQAMAGAGANNNGLVTKQEFIDYFTAIAASLQPQYLPVLIERGFGIEMKTRSSSSSSSTNSMSRSNSWQKEIRELVSEVRSLLREKVRQKTSSTGSESEQLRRAFKHFDLKNTGQLPQHEFGVALERYGVVLPPLTLSRLFAAFATTTLGTPLINYSEFAAALYEDDETTNSYTRRQEQVEQARETLRAQRDGRTYLESDALLLSTPNASHATSFTAAASSNLNSSSSSSSSSSSPTVIVFVMGGPCVGVEDVCDRMHDLMGFQHLNFSSLTKTNTLSDTGRKSPSSSSSSESVSVMKQSIAEGVREGSRFFLVSGFPTSLADKTAFEHSNSGAHVPFVLYLDAPNAVLVERAKAKANLTKTANNSVRTNNNINMSMNTGKLVTEMGDAIRGFADVVLPVVEAYQREGKLRIVNAAASLEELCSQVQLHLSQI